MMRWTREHILAAVTAVVVVAGTALGVALVGNSTPKRPVHPLPSVSPSKIKPAVHHHRLVSPFTGEPIKALGRVLTVKIDNIVYARPQTGINLADIVYVIPVEGGLTRFLAVFSSRIPPIIGPVRSARRDDLQLLGQFGRPAFAFSGAQGQLLPVVEHARIVNLYAGVTSGYYRNFSRIAPYNLFARTHVLMAKSKRASKAKDIGFRFGPPPAGGHKTKTITVTYPAARYTFAWSKSAHRWLVSMDGRPAKTSAGKRFAPATVVIQHTVVRKSLYLEYGAAPPYAVTIGRGNATVLRNGREYNVHWSRRYFNGPTIFKMANGHRMTFTPGQVWILLVGNRKVEAG